MKVIHCHCGEPILLDDEDYPKVVEAGNWSCQGRNVYKHRQSGHYSTSMSLAEFIFGSQPNMIVDHKDRNKHNNQKNNFRFATKGQNRINSKISSNNTSGYRGVAFNKRTGKWAAVIGYNGKKVHMGLFLTPELAAIAYNIKAKELFGEFAALNEISTGVITPSEKQQ